MSSKQQRLDLSVDVFEKQGQRARSLPGLKPAELVQAILSEFRELEYLQHDADAFRLLHDGKPLLADVGIGEQVANGAHLQLSEIELEEQQLPDGTGRPSRPLYLREMASGEVYRIHWLPAIIGRPDPAQPMDAWLAIDMQPYKSGLRVSRRHAMIREEDGQLYVSSLSRNPTQVRRANGEVLPVTGDRMPIYPGDMIALERSRILLKVLHRGGAEEAAESGKGLLEDPTVIDQTIVAPGLSDVVRSQSEQATNDNEQPGDRTTPVG